MKGAVDMAVSKKVRGTASAMPMGILLGTMTGAAMLGIASLILAWLIHSGKVRVSTMGYISMGILLITAAAGSLLAILRVKRRKILVGLLTGGSLYAVLLGTNALFFGGHYQGMLTTALMIFVGSLTPAVLGMRGEVSSHKRAKKIKKW